jgi:hypothetical protein
MPRLDIDAEGPYQRPERDDEREARERQERRARIAERQRRRQQDNVADRPTIREIVETFEDVITPQNSATRADPQPIRITRSGDLGIVAAAAETSGNTHNMDTREDVRQRTDDYERGWLPEAVYSPYIPFKWARIVKRISSYTEHGMRCFPGTYMADEGPTSVTPGDVCLVCTDNKLIFAFIFLLEGHWFRIQHTPVGWTGDWAANMCRVIESWVSLPRTLRIYRACNEAITELVDCLNEFPEADADQTLTEACATYRRLLEMATSHTGSLTIPLIRETIQNLIHGLVRRTDSDEDTVVNLLATVLEDHAHAHALRRRKIIELRIEGLDELLSAVLLIFGANIRQGSAVSSLQRALEAVQHNANQLENWITSPAACTPETWKKVTQQSATRTRQLTRFNLRNRSADNADRPGISTDNSGQT